MRGPPVRSPPRLVPPRLVDPPRAAAAEAPASPSCALRGAMAASSARPAALVMPALALLLLLCVGPGGISGNKLKLMLQKGEAPAPPTTPVAVPESRAKEFLSGLRRLKRQLWDRTRPEVQQWYQHFLYLGFDEAKFEDDITYWLNRGRNGHDYYDYHQRHHDEDAEIGPWSPDGFRHGASVNYDDY
ncbi:augurin [Balaenoptera musculus]|uniref:Augurin n=1 Tax=Balaenoptera musculus TaxID=9771 RepID=A0A8B8Z2H9_BALMU|nr:augurin [Balaenoptera musculus]